MSPSSSPRLEDGWVIVACDASDGAVVHMAVGAKLPDQDSDRWADAFRAWDSTGARVAKIRPPEHGKFRVFLRVDGKVTASPRSIEM